MVLSALTFLYQITLQAIQSLWKNGISATAQENEMKYNVFIADQETRARLEELFPGRVGSGVVSNVVIVEGADALGDSLEGEQFFSDITYVEGVISVEPDTETEPVECGVIRTRDVRR